MKTLQQLFDRIFDPVDCGDLGEFCDIGWVITVDQAKKIAEEFGLALSEEVD